ncbi:hypothetical protein ABZ318_37915 [Streptomyces sp. NPDC006197]|uniref:hypothetical protein n=1 Tax=Streptomyces sp. NPDC006197 TaxID=3156685 RepID=UPI0033A4F972
MNLAAARTTVMYSGSDLTLHVQGLLDTECGGVYPLWSGPDGIVMSGRTHRTRLARTFASAQPMAYQKALHHVIACSEAGLLPARLDGAGMEQALVVLQQNLGAPGMTRRTHSSAEPSTAATATAETVLVKQPALSKDPRCLALAEALKPVLQASCPEGAGGYGGALQANLHPADAERLGGMGLIRAAMRRAARQLGWRVRTLGYARDRLVMVIVQDIRDAPAEFADALEADFMSACVAMHQRMEAGRDEEALSALGPAPVERQTRAFLQAARAAITTDPDAWR